MSSSSNNNNDNKNSLTIPIVLYGGLKGSIETSVTYNTKTGKYGELFAPMDDNIDMSSVRVYMQKPQYNSVVFVYRSTRLHHPQKGRISKVGEKLSIVQGKIHFMGSQGLLVVKTANNTHSVFKWPNNKLFVSLDEQPNSFYANDHLQLKPRPEKSFLPARLEYKLRNILYAEPYYVLTMNERSNIGILIAYMRVVNNSHDVDFKDFDEVFFSKKPESSEKEKTKKSNSYSRSKEVFYTQSSVHQSNSSNRNNNVDDYQEKLIKAIKKSSETAILIPAPNLANKKYEIIHHSQTNIQTKAWSGLSISKQHWFHNAGQKHPFVRIPVSSESIGNTEDFLLPAKVQTSEDFSGVLHPHDLQKRQDTKYQDGYLIELEKDILVTSRLQSKDTTRSNNSTSKTVVYSLFVENKSTSVANVFYRLDLEKNGYILVEAVSTIGNRKVEDYIPYVHEKHAISTKLRYISFILGPSKSQAFKITVKYRQQ